MCLLALSCRFNLMWRRAHVLKLDGLWAVVLVFSVFSLISVSCVRSTTSTGCTRRVGSDGDADWFVPVKGDVKEDVDNVGGEGPLGGEGSVDADKNEGGDEKTGSGDKER